MAEKYPPRQVHSVPNVMRLSGLEPLNYNPDTSNMRKTFLNIGERCNVAGSALYKKAIVDGEYDKASHPVTLLALNCSIITSYGELRSPPGRFDANCPASPPPGAMWKQLIVMTALIATPAIASAGTKGKSSSSSRAQSHANQASKDAAHHAKSGNSAAAKSAEKRAASRQHAANVAKKNGR